MGDAHEVWIGPIGPIHVDGDATEQRRAAEEGARRAGLLITVDEMVGALRHDSDKFVRMQVVPRLAARGGNDPRTLSALIAALGDPAWEVRDAVACALWSIADPKAADALASALEDEADDVRWSAAYGLAGRRDKRSVEFFLRDLRNRDEGRREWAAKALGGLADASALGPLTDALDDPSETVRSAAREALSEINQA